MLGWLFSAGVLVIVFGCLWMYIHSGKIAEVVSMGITTVFMLSHLYFIKVEVLWLLITTGVCAIIAGGIWMAIHNEGRWIESFVVSLTIACALVFLNIWYRL